MRCFPATACARAAAAVVGLLAGPMLLPAGASALTPTLYAAPAGTGVECSIATPCPITTAVASAASGQTVSLAPGTYLLSKQLVAKPDVLLQGNPTKPRPVLIDTSPNGVGLLSMSGGDLYWVTLRGGTKDYDGRVYLGDGRATSVDTDGDIYVNGGRVVSSVAASIGAEGKAQLRHVTLHTVGGLYVEPGSSVLVMSSLITAPGTARGTKFIGGAPSSVTFDHSAIDGVSGNDLDHQWIEHPAGMVHTEADWGLFQPLGAVTVDAGTYAGFEDGIVDIDGDLRVSGAAADIGADEQPLLLAPAPQVVLDGTSASVSVGVNTGGARGASALIRVVDDVNGSIRLAPTIFLADNVLQDLPIAAEFDGLVPGHGYHAQVFVLAPHNLARSSDTSAFAVPTPQLPAEQPVPEQPQPAPPQPPDPHGSSDEPLPLPLPAPVPAPKASTAVAPLSVSVLPSAKVCLSRRDFQIRINPRTAKLLTAKVTVNGKTVPVRRNVRIAGLLRWTARINLKGKRKQTITVKVTGQLRTTAGTRTYTQIRKYHTCF